MKYLLALLLVSFSATQALSQERAPNGAALKQSAREAFATAEPDKAREHLRVLLDLYRTTYAAGGRLSDKYQWSQRLAEVAHEYLRGGQLEDALEVLGEAADLNLPFEEKLDDGLGSAAAGLHRRLAALDSDQRFELLHQWSMPTETRRGMRGLTAITPTDAPPAIFARSLGERRRRNTFATPGIGAIRGVFCTAWELVNAAEEAGSLRKLMTELSRLANDKDDPHARLAWTMAKIVSARRPDNDLRDEITVYTNLSLDRSGDSSFDTLPLEQRVWKFGHGQFDADSERTADFRGFSFWDGQNWRGGSVHPDPDIDWAVLREDGGHPGSARAAIRRWTAPAGGTLSVIGELRKDRSGGDGIRGRLICSRSGLADQWVVRSGLVPTNAKAITVERGDTIDFMVDHLGDTDFDAFSWRAKLQLRTNDGQALNFDSATGFHGPAHSNSSLVIAATCLTQDWLQPIGERVLKARLEQTYRDESLLLRPFLRRAHALAIRARHPDASPEVLTDHDLQLWVASNSKSAQQSAQGAVRPLWLARDGHILHQTGPRNDYLFFKYPLTGEFEFSCDTQIGGQRWTGGGIAYGGLGYEAWAARQLFKVFDASLRKVAELHCPFVPDNTMATFHRFSLKSGAEGVTLSLNGHPTWTDTSMSRTSPWIGLRSWGERVPIFRNLEITGNPVIPREVSMSDGNSLRGWVANYYGERTPPPGPPQLDFDSLFKRFTTRVDWSARDGVIYGYQQPTSSGAVVQSRLYYARPLQDGESVSYEFLYEPGRIAVHPTLGRMAFLIDPDGVRLHWMTDGDREWTGLAENNSAIDPISRRGPKPLPLTAGEWNRVAVELDGDKVKLSLNGTAIYLHKLEAASERTFGFYHDKGRTASHVRNVVMRGDWPERLTEEQLDQLAAVSKADRPEADRRLVGAVFDDQHVHGAVLAIHRRASSLPAEERYALLSNWVLPNPDHQSLRLALDFTPTNPAPPVSREASNLASDKPSADQGMQGTRVTTGGDIVSPALDLVAVAKELGKLDELRERIIAIPAAEEHSRRCQLAMLALIDIALEDLVRARATLDELASLVAAGDTVLFAERCPETLVIWSAAPFKETRDAVRDMADEILLRQIRKNRPSGYEAWNHQIRALASRARYFDLRDADPRRRDAPAKPFHGEAPLANWVPVSRAITRSRGQGFPRSHWELSSPSTVDNFASHYGDFLFFRTPMRGNFEVEADVGGFGWWETSMWIAGRHVGPVYTLRQYDIGDFRSKQRPDLDTPMHRPDRWIRYRAVVRDGVCTTYFNGLRAHDRVLAAEHDPWVAIYSPYTTNGAVRNVRITGEPEIPDVIRLTASADLPGWLPINEGHAIGNNRKWQQLGDVEDGGGIRGIRWPDLPGSHRETLLRYHRPMVEDGTIEYEFFYRENEVHVHPALDRLAFMLQPGGVHVHWVTDGKYDRTELGPTNLFAEPENRRGPAALPLKPDAWNRLKLSLAGDTVDLVLNGELVYQRRLEPTNQRTFGLFHYADRTEALVRNIVWRGDWPRELPPVTAQELAGEGTEFLEQSQAELTATFEHGFAESGLPTGLFTVGGGKLDDFDARADGVHVTRPGAPGYHDATIAPRLTVEGDFDIIAAFEHFEPAPSAGGSGGLFLEAILDNAKSNECRMYRRLIRHREPPQPIAQASYVTYEAVGTRRSRFNKEVVEATAGRLRLSRRGKTVYFLFAEGDSPNFRLFGTQASTQDKVSEVRLVAQCQGEGSTTVVWKSVSIRAHKINGLALADQAALLAALDRQRDAFSQRFHYDPNSALPVDDVFSRWGPLTAPDSNGLPVLSIGRDDWTSAGLSPEVGLAGDFDISVDIDDVRFGSPKEKDNSAVYLQVQFPDAGNTQASVLFVEYPRGDRQILAQIKVTDADGNANYRRMRIEQVEEVKQLRLARRGARVSFIYRREGAEQDQVIAQTEIMDSPIAPGNVRLLVHTGGAGRQSQLRVKRFAVQAEEIDPNPSQAPPNLEAWRRQLIGDLPASALEFDGQTQFVTVPSMHYDGSHPLTLEAFLTPDDLRGLILGDTQQAGIGLGLKDRKYNVHAWNGTSYSGSVSAAAARFLRVHLAGTFDGQTLTLFVNGKRSVTRQLPGAFVGSGLPFTIGASPSPDGTGMDFPFEGLIDEVRVSKSIRYTEDFTVPDAFDPDENTLAVFRVDEAQGNLLTDLSGHKNHGHLRGARWVTGDAIRLRAVDGLVELGRHGVPVFRAALDHEDLQVRLHAITGLGRIGEDAKAALPALKVIAAKERDTRVSQAAFQAIRQIETGGVLKSILNLFGR